MIHKGYHDENVWTSVLFQMLAGLHAMYKNKIVIKDMQLHKNIFIKDLMTNNQIGGHWKYVINNFEYHVNRSFILWNIFKRPTCLLFVLCGYFIWSYSINIFVYFCKKILFT